MKEVLVLMSTYNGEKYLKEQIDSILNQKEVKISLLVRDDGSTDNTHAILNKYQDAGKLKWYCGNNLGPARSFIDLIKNAPDSEYYAFSDQDDIWLDNKMKRAIDKLGKYSENIPLLYYGVPILVDSKLNILETPKELNDKMLTYASSIINSNAVGCTMLFNKNLLEKVKKANTPTTIQMHDAWIHKICIIFKGKLEFDDKVPIYYRQHVSNVIGVSNSKLKKFKNHIKSFKLKPCYRSKTIAGIYNCFYADMDDEDRYLSELVVNYKSNFWCKIKLLFCRKIKTTSVSRNILFKCAVLFNIF